jgi:hypothetical protein
MLKAIVKINYKEYIMDTKDALHILDLLSKAERYETKYDHENKTKTYHVYDVLAEDKTEHLEVIHDDLYRMAKLAGRPTKG